MTIKLGSQWPRREFLRASGSTALFAFAGAPIAVPNRGKLGFLGGDSTPNTASPGATTLRDPRVKALVVQTLDTARSAGAHYADVRVTSTRMRSYNHFRHASTMERVTLGLSVRALVNGYWGWAATPFLMTTEGSQVARDAVQLAKDNALGGRPRTVEWEPVPVVADGSWATPIVIDPFELALEEGMDWVEGMSACIGDLTGDRGEHGAHVHDPDDGTNTGDVNVQCFKQERIFASTDGSYLNQTISVLAPTITFWYRGVRGDVRLPPAQGGWEYLIKAPILDVVRQEIARIDAEKAHPLPIVPIVDIGRYDIVFTAPSMAAVLNGTLGYATQLDRALGYEANSGGTSYLGPDPLQFLGTPVASPLVTVTADRSAPQSVATVQWDDEGVVPEDFTLVNKGVLVDYQTTREQAAWLAPWYTKRGMPVRSHGCAAAPEALMFSMQHTPNLTLHPGTAEIGVNEMITDLTKGLVVDQMNVDMDWQHLNGLAHSRNVTVVRNGKRVAKLDPEEGITLMFRSPEFWKNISVIGGPASQMSLFSGLSDKGIPEQRAAFSMAVVPALVKEQAVVNLRRRA